MVIVFALWDWIILCIKRSKMKAIVSTTYDDKYLFFLPIITWCWNRLGVDVICFVPKPSLVDADKVLLINQTCGFNKLLVECHYFECPEHKEATYAQCSRLYASALDLPEDEVLITSDIDMAVFEIPPLPSNGKGFAVFGTDLVPGGQYPMCYITATQFEWRKAFNPSQLVYQKCLDNLLGNIDCESFRGNYWGKDQETAWMKIMDYAGQGEWRHLFDRARPGTQFASQRVDRDDINWRSYCGPALIDAHLWRPGYEENNFNNILELLHLQYPEDDFKWLIDYRSEYIKLI